MGALAQDSTQMYPSSRWLVGLLASWSPTIAAKEVCVAQFHSLALGTFASFVAPFGGFLASAIKRAYGIKDFAAVIPGHGGLMDRFDCQFVMAMCTYVHQMTFCRVRVSPTVNGLLNAVAYLAPQDREEFIKLLYQQQNQSGERSIG